MKWQGREESIMNAIITAFAEQGLILGAILLLAIYMQAKLHGLGDGLRKEMSDMKDDLRKEMSDMKDGLRKDIVKLGERVAKIEGLLMPASAYGVVAEPAAEEGYRAEPEAVESKSQK